MTMTSQNQKSVISQPGAKLFFAGEHAVAKAGHKALIANIEAEFKLELRASKDDLNHLKTNIPLEKLSFKMTEIGQVFSKDWAFVLKVLEKIKQVFPEKLSKEAFQLDIQSGLGYGDNKLGYGSSASIVVALVQALNQFYDLALSQEESFKIAAASHYEVQGSGSMGDVAAISYGSVIAYQSPNIKKNWQNLEIKSINLPSDWSTYVIRTGESIKTHEKLKKELPESFYRESDQLVEKATQAIQEHDFSAFREALLANQELLRSQLSEGYISPKLRIALKVFEDNSQTVAKISGSGFGENIFLFTQGEQAELIGAAKKKLAQSDIVLEKIEIRKSYDKKPASTS